MKLVSLFNRHLTYSCGLQSRRHCRAKIDVATETLEARIGTFLLRSTKTRTMQDHDGEDACLFFEIVLIVLLVIEAWRLLSTVWQGKYCLLPETARNRKQSSAEAIGVTQSQQISDKKETKDLGEKFEGTQEYTNTCSILKNKKLKNYKSCFEPFLVGHPQGVYISIFVKRRL